MQIAAGVASLDDCRLHVYSTVVSSANPQRAVIDAGSKISTSGSAKISRLSEEHGVLDLSSTNRRPNSGDACIVPNHACVVANTVDDIVLVRGTEIVGTLPVAARSGLK